MDNKLVNQIACVLDNTLVNCLPHKTVAIHILSNVPLIHTARCEAMSSSSRRTKQILMII